MKTTSTRLLRVLPTLARCLILGTLLTPLVAMGQARDWNWRYCRLGEPCADRLIENGDRTIQEKMQEAQAAAARIRNAEAQTRSKETFGAVRPSKPAETVPPGNTKPDAQRPAGVAADDMRFWSVDDCATHYDHSVADYQECARFVTSDAAKQARIDRACRERHPASAEAFERCRVPLQSDATAAVAAAAAAAVAAAAKPAVPAAGAPATGTGPPAGVQATNPVRASAGAGRAGSDDAISSIWGTLLSIVALVLGAVAVRCWKPQLGWPQVFLAACMGLLSGIMFYLLAALTVAGQSTPVPAALALVAVVVGWTASVYVVLNGAVSVARVVNRGFLLGAVEWMLMIPAGLFFASRLAAENLAHPGRVADHGAILFGASIGGDVLAFLTGGIAVVMAGVCLVGFAVTYFISGHLEPQAPRAKRKCPECAEMIQAEARKCRYCGAVLKQPKSAARVGPRTVTHTITRTGARPATRPATPKVRGSG